MKTVIVSGKYEALVDDEDYDKVSAHRWQVNKRRPLCYYAQTAIVSDGGYPTTISMHRFILNAKPGQTIDHKDGNGLNNQRSNIRFCSIRQQLANRVKQRNSLTNYKGVCKAYGGQWRARIRINGKKVQVGRFLTQEEAAAAYNKVAHEMYGEFSLPNGVR